MGKINYFHIAGVKPKGDDLWTKHNFILQSNAFSVQHFALEDNNEFIRDLYHGEPLAGGVHAWGTSMGKVMSWDFDFMYKGMSRWCVSTATPTVD